VAEKINRELVQKVARLSRLELSDKQTERFTSQLSAILEYVHKMDDLNTDNVEPLAHCLPVDNVMRTDEAAESIPVRKALANAPGANTSFFRVPKVLDEDAGII